MRDKSIKNKCITLRNILAVCILFLCLFIGSNVYATERRTIKVAFFPMDGYHTVNEDGSYGDMDVEYLHALSNYVSWNVEYVECDSWEDALWKLKNKEVDLVGSAHHYRV